MVSARDIAALRTEHAALADMAGGDLRQFFATLDLSDPEAVRDLLLETVPELTTVYGNATSTVAADWYDDIRYTERVPGDFRALMGNPVETEFVRKRIRYGANHLFTMDPELTLTSIAGAVQKYVLQPGRDTIQGSSMRDPQAAGWVRIARPDACNFCKLLAGRKTATGKQGVYKRPSVDFASHYDCYCTAVPSWDLDAEEIDVKAYVASEKAYRKTPEQLESHNAALREYLKEWDG